MDNVLIIIVTLVLSAFFSGMEIAFVSSNNLKIEIDRGKGLLSARIIAFFNQNPPRFIGALLLGNNVALVIYGIATANLLEPLLMGGLPVSLQREWVILILQTIIATLVILFTAEFLPKALFRIKPNYILNLFAIPVFIFYIVFYPFIIFFIGLGELIIKFLFRAHPRGEKYVFSTVDLDHYVREFSPEIPMEGEMQQEIQMFQNAIDFRNIKLRECMVPRTEIAALGENDSVHELRRLFIESGYSKILVYRDTIDHIVGYIHTSDLFKNPADIRSITRSIIVVPETMLANNVLSTFIREHKSVAVVVDEFGGTSGMVTMEDIIEEIFGEIEDEFDDEELIERKAADGGFILSGRLEIDYLNEKYNLELPESEDYETLAGLIIHHHESIPNPHEEIRIGRFVFVILQAGDARIDLVHLKFQE